MSFTTKVKVVETKPLDFGYELVAEDSTDGQGDLSFTGKVTLEATEDVTFKKGDVLTVVVSKK
jgi:hypothetical protein